MKKVYLYLFAGVLVASSSSIIVRWIGPVPASVISFYRLFFSTLFLLIYYLSIKKQKNDTQRLSKFHWQYILAGLFLSAHLVSWIASLQLTTIANSIFLEGTHPIFSVIFSVIFLKEVPGKNTWPAFILALAGMFVIVSGDVGMGDGALTGDILAISSAAFLALYLMIARFHRNDPDLIKYLIYVYGAAALFTLVYIFFESDPLTGFSTASWILMLIQALGPNLTGHSLLNWASRHIEIFKVNLALTLEPVLATLSGIIFIAEYPAPGFYIGASLVLSGLAILAISERRNSTHRLDSKSETGR